MGTKKFEKLSLFRNHDLKINVWSNYQNAAIWKTFTSGVARKLSSFGVIQLQTDQVIGNGSERTRRLIGQFRTTRLVIGWKRRAVIGRNIVRFLIGRHLIMSQQKFGVEIWEEDGAEESCKMVQTWLGIGGDWIVGLKINLSFKSLEICKHYEGPKLNTFARFIILLYDHPL